MNIKKTHEIISPAGEKVVLWNFSLNKYPSPLHSFVSAELETAHQLVQQYARETNEKMKLEIFDSIIFYHDFLQATYLARRDAAKNIGLSIDEMRDADTNRKKMLFDANARAISFTPPLLPGGSPDGPEMPSSSAAIADELEARRRIVSATQSAKAKKNTGPRISRKSIVIQERNKTKESKK